MKITDNSLQYDDKNVQLGQQESARYKWLIRMICLLVSILLWIYFENLENPRDTVEINNIPIEIRNTEILDSIEQGKQYVIQSGENETLSVTISKNMNSSFLKASDIIAYVDLEEADFSNGNAVAELTIHVDKSQLPRGTNISDMSREKLEVQIDTKITEIKTIQYEITKGATLEGDYYAEITLKNNEQDQIKEIKVEGPEWVVDRVDKAVVYVDYTSKTKTYAYAGKIVLLDQNGEKLDASLLKYVKTEPQNITVSVNIYQQKLVDLTYELELSNDLSAFAEITLSPSQVYVKGDTMYMNQNNLVKPIQIDQRLIEEEMRNNKDGTIVRYLETADGIEIVDSNEVKVDITINYEIVNEATYTIIPENIQITDTQNNNWKIRKNTPLKIRVIGAVDVIRALEARDIQVYVNLNDYDENTTGIQMVPVERIYFDYEIPDNMPEEYRNIGVYEIGSYYVEVDFGNG